MPLKLAAAVAGAGLGGADEEAGVGVREGSRLEADAGLPPGRWSSDVPNPANGSFLGVALGGTESWAIENAFENIAINTIVDCFINSLSKGSFSCF